MELNKEIVSPVTTNFTITIPAAEIADKITEWITERAKTVKISGFRPGKVPLSIVRQNYADQAEATVIRDIIQNAVQRILKDEKLEPIVRPVYQIDEYTPGGDLKASVTIDTAPQFDLKDFKEIHIEKIVNEPTEEELEAEFQNFVKEYKKFTLIPDTEVQMGDLVLIKILTQVGGRPVSSLSMESTIFNIQPSDDEFHTVLMKNLLGQKPGSEVEIKHTMSKNTHIKQIAGKKVTIHVTPLEISRLQPTEFTEEEASRIGYENIDIVKEKIYEGARAQRQSVLQLCNKRSVLDALAEVYTFDVPESLVENDFKKVWEYVAPELENARANDDADVKDKTNEEIAAEYRAVSNRRVRLGFIIDKIAKEYDITIKQELVAQALQQEVERYPGEEREVIRFYEKNPPALYRLINPLVENIVVEKVLELADIKEIPLSKEELDERAKEVLP